jgi:dihydroxyacetone kinase-like predicted kinase
VASGLALALADSDAELLTVVTGLDAAATEVDEVVAAISRDLPRVQLEVLEGGQRRYPYLIGAE